MEGAHVIIDIKAGFLSRFEKYGKWERNIPEMVIAVVRNAEALLSQHPYPAVRVFE